MSGKFEARVKDFKNNMFFQRVCFFFESLEMMVEMCSRLEFDMFGASMNQQTNGENRYTIKSKLSLACGEMEGRDLPWCN